MRSRGLLKTPLIFIGALGAALLICQFLPRFAVASSASFEVGLTVEGCNSNLVCEIGSNESVANCPSDCTNFQCSNGLDDDGDGSVDYPNDPHCDSALDNRESADGGGSSSGGTGEASCSLYINPSVIMTGEMSTLTWSSTESGLQRTIKPELDAVAGSGAVVVSPAETTTYVGSFSGLRNTAICTATLTVETSALTPGQINFGTDSYVVSENAGGVAIGLHRVGGSGGMVSVEVASVVASADGKDFEVKTELITWQDGDSDTKIFYVPVYSDIFDESDEVFIVQIKPLGDSLVMGNPAFASVVIKDSFVDPDPTTLTIIKRVINNNEGRLSPRDFLLTLDGSQVFSGETVVVDPSRPLVINEISPSGYELVSITGSSGCPGLLSEPVTLSVGQDLICIITSDDAPPQTEKEAGIVSFTTNSILVTEGERVSVNISRHLGSFGDVLVSIKSTDGTAFADNDYQSLSQDVAWQGGESGEKSFIFQSWDDNLVEGNESLTLHIASSSISLADPKIVTILIIDNDSPDPDCVGATCFAITPNPGGPPEIGENIYTPIIDALHMFKNLYDIPLVQDVSQFMSGLGVLVGLWLLLAIGFGLQNLWLSSLRSTSLLLSMFGLRRKARPWGTVYDSVTKQSLGPVVVYLYDKNGEEVKSVITGLDGRYGFSVEPGTYTLTAHKTHYLFPSKHLAGKTKDELYEHLYFGETFEIEKEVDVIAHNIPMDSEKFDWNEFAKRDARVTKSYRRRDRWLVRVGQAIFLAGFIFAFFAFLYVPQPYNFVIFVLYIAILFLALLGMRRRKTGMVTERITGNPLAFAVIRIFAPISGQEVGHVVTDSTGRYFKSIANGTYRIRIERKVSEDNFELVFEQKNVVIKRGILDKKFHI